MVEELCAVELVQGRDVNDVEPDGRISDERGSRVALEDLETLIRRVTLI